MVDDSVQMFDLIIVGSGMVGATLACALAETKLKIAVIEANQVEFDWPEGSHDIRVSAITHASQHIFENIGAWQSMVKEGVTAYREMHVWDNAGEAMGQTGIHFNSLDVGQSDLGHIIENRVIQKAVFQRMQAFNNIQILMPVKLKHLNKQADSIELLTEDGQVLTTRLLVGADGANSWVRQQAAVELNTWAYHQTAIVCNVATEYAHQQACWQKFMPDGPLAFLPLNDGQSSIVWSARESLANTLLALDDESFNDKLSETIADSIGGQLGKVRLSSQRGAFPLRLRHARHYVQDHLALIGDAAHTVHPLAGQGVNLGLLDAAVLAEEIISSLHNGREIGALSTLRRYERRRKSENIAMLAAMDGFKRLFSNDFLPLKLIRNIGLSLADKASPIKHLAIKRAMGLLGEVPDLAKPR